jgi:hypothetical protein
MSRAISEFCDWHHARDEIELDFDACRSSRGDVPTRQKEGLQRDQEPEDGSRIEIHGQRRDLYHMQRGGHSPYAKCKKDQTYENESEESKWRTRGVKPATYRGPAMTPVATINCNTPVVSVLHSPPRV